MKNANNKLHEYYNSLPAAVYPKAEFIMKIVNATGKTHQAVRSWIYGGIMPKRKELCIEVANAIGAEVTDIFPDFETRYRK